jgi:hypothetical protein
MMQSSVIDFLTDTAGTCGSSCGTVSAFEVVPTSAA